MNKGQNRILIAVDGSRQAMEAARFVCRTVSPSTSSAKLFQVVSAVPEVFYDLGSDPIWKEKIDAIRTWEEQQKARAVNTMAETAALFLQAGFKQESVTTNISDVHEGIARDIIREARQGYDVLVIGRGKEQAGQSSLLGGAASKILSTASAPAVWLVGKNASPEKILVAVDSSESARLAVEHAGKLLDSSGNQLLLFHAIRGVSASPDGLGELFPHDYQQRLLADAEKNIKPIMSQFEEQLHQMGINAQRISSKIVTGVSSRAAAIVEEAQKGEYGTIVVGRRGVSSVTDFFMGRVSKKLTQLAESQALCIVG